MARVRRWGAGVVPCLETRHTTSVSTWATQAAQTRAQFELALHALLVRHGAADGPTLRSDVVLAVDAMLASLVASAHDGSSLSPLDVVRIRAQKLAAVQLSPSLWRDARALAGLRAELCVLASQWLGPNAARGSRFGSTPPGSRG